MPWVRRLVAGLSRRRPEFVPRFFYVNFVLHTEEVRQPFSRIFSFCPVCVILLMLHYLYFIYLLSTPAVDNVVKKSTKKEWRRLDSSCPISLRHLDRRLMYSRRLGQEFVLQAVGVEYWFKLERWPDLSWLSAGRPVLTRPLELDLWLNHLKPKRHIYIYICRTASLTSRRYILNIYSTNIHTEYFKHAA